MVATKKRGAGKKTKRSKSKIFKSNGKVITLGRISECKKSFSRKCNSEFLTAAYNHIRRKEGLKGKSGGFSPAQCKRALSMASKGKKGAHFSTAYKNKIHKSRSQKAHSKRR